MKNPRLERDAGFFIPDNLMLMGGCTGPIASRLAPTGFVVNANQVFDTDQMWERACSR
ncbi:hypothetical protein ACQR3P_26470 [Rhodococcus sp. IEGM1300]